MRVICERCKREFNMKQEMLQEKYLGAMLTEIFYNCPKCGHRYLICIQNAKCRKLKAKLDIESKKLYSITNDVEKVLKSKMLDNIQIELKKETDRINGKSS